MNAIYSSNSIVMVDLLEYLCIVAIDEIKCELGKLEKDSDNLMI